MTKKHTVTRKEFFTIALLAFFAFLWVAIVIPYLMGAQWFQALVPPLQYGLYSLGFMAIFVLLFGFPLTYYFRHKIVWHDIFRIGFSAWAIESLVLDLWYPPFYVGPGGEILAIPGALSGTSVDGMIAWCWQAIGISGPLLFYFTYLLAPFIVVLVLALLLAPKQFVGLFTK